MPYIIETRTPPTTGAMACCTSTIGAGRCGHMLVQSRRAVAALDEKVRGELHAIVHVAYSAAYPIEPRGLGGEHSDAQRAHYRHSCDVSRMDESGGTVGPLPDGTVIAVEPITYSALLVQADALRPRNEYLLYGPGEVIDAYNAAQGA